MNLTYRSLLPALLAATLLAGCAAGAATPVATDDPSGAVAAEELFTGAVALDIVDLESEAVALAGTPASSILTPVASGAKVKKNDKATIDYSNTKDGYVMVKYTAKTDKRLKAVVLGPSGDTAKYQYNLNWNEWTVFPLSDGNGEYKVSVYEKVSADESDTKYANMCSVSFQVTLSDEFAPFLRPNQYVDYGVAPNTVAKAAELTAGMTDPLQKVTAVYDFVVENLTYDKELAANVAKGYLPVLDNVLANKKGICFDYAALMTGMLRSQSVPCKLVVGYAGKQYHAWISVWSAETGWVEGVVYFDGATWQRMDPTFASNSHGSVAIMQYIGDGSNYTVKYLY